MQEHFEPDYRLPPTPTPASEKKKISCFALVSVLALCCYQMFLFWNVMHNLQESVLHSHCVPKQQQMVPMGLFP